MIVIRREQMKAFQSYVVDNYVERTLERIEMQRRDAFARLGPAGTDALIRDGVARAGSYGIEDDAEVDRYIDLMLRLGTRFDEDPALAWARFILEDRKLDARAKMNLIYQSDELPTAARG